MKRKYTLNIKGRLLELERPLVMGILNVTPDSFYDGSRVEDAAGLVERARKMLNEGAAILDVGACSTRPGAALATEAEEIERLHRALELIDKEFPQAVVSIDTFRANVVRECCRCHNVSIINDVSGYEWDNMMFEAVCELNIPYVLTHSRGFAGECPHYDDFVPEVMQQLARKIWQLHQQGVKDVIVDPGFGFGKTLEQNYMLMEQLHEFSLLDAPLLVGVSRKSMITKLLGVKADEALNGTTVLNTIALSKGADILRVHDVAQAVQAIEIYCKLSADMP